VGSRVYGFPCFPLLVISTALPDSNSWQKLVYDYLWLIRRLAVHLEVYRHLFRSAVWGCGCSVGRLCGPTVCLTKSFASIKEEL